MSATMTKPKKATEKKNLTNVEEVKKIVKSVSVTADDRIKNAENFGILTKKYQFLKTKNEDLQSFKISSDGTKEHLKLENAAGFTFTVSNSNVMQKVVGLLQTELSGLLSATEKEVKEFEV